MEAKVIPQWLKDKEETETTIIFLPKLGQTFQPPKSHFSLAPSVNSSCRPQLSPVEDDGKSPRTTSYLFLSLWPISWFWVADFFPRDFNPSLVSLHTTPAIFLEIPSLNNELPNWEPLIGLPELVMLPHWSIPSAQVTMLIPHDRSTLATLGWIKMGYWAKDQ